MSSKTIYKWVHGDINAYKDDEHRLDTIQKLVFMSFTVGLCNAEREILDTLLAWDEARHVVSDEEK